MRELKTSDGQRKLIDLPWHFKEQKRRGEGKCGIFKKYLFSIPRRCGNGLQQTGVALYFLSSSQAGVSEIGYEGMEQNSWTRSLSVGYQNAKRSKIFPIRNKHAHSGKSYNFERGFQNSSIFLLKP